MVGHTLAESQGKKYFIGSSNVWTSYNIKRGTLEIYFHSVILAFSVSKGGRWVKKSNKNGVLKIYGESETC